MSPTPDRIRWLDEMLVTRQHLQLLSERSEALIQALPGRYHPFFWGVSRCDYELKAGNLTVQALDAVMPNGFHVAIDKKHAPLVLDVGSHAGGPRQTPLLVHIAMLLDEPDAGERRFVGCERETADMVVGDDGVEIRRRPTALVLLAGEAPPESQYTSFPLFELRWEGSAYRVTDFMPPTLRVARDSALGRTCASIPDRLRREASVVAGRGVDTLEAPFSADVRAQLNPIVCALPAFEVLCAAATHPFALYLELCRLAGAVAALRSRVVPPKFSDYDHNDARAGFDQVVRCVLGLADETVSGGARRFTFERDGPWFRLPPDPGWTDALDIDSRLQLVLAMQTDAGETLARKWGDNCVIASHGAIQSLVSRRVLGVPRRLVTPGAALPSQPDLYLFQLSRDAEAVRPGEELLVLGDLPDIRPSALYLYVIGAERERTDG